MATATLKQSESALGGDSRRVFVAITLVVIVAACLLAGWAPLGFSIVTVFLFAGPHNWMEARYFIERMPARWGKLRTYFTTGIVGVLLLVGTFIGLPYLAQAAAWSDEMWLTSLAAWNTGLIGWVVTLAWMRSRQNPRRAWSWVIPAGLALIAVAWLWPRQWGLGLVYAHPLVALWFLDREIKRLRPQWRSAYHCCLVAVAVALVGLWWQLAGTPDLPGRDALAIRIARHAGAGMLDGVSSHLLVATHTFLEMLHYGVWLVAIPSLGLRSRPWRLNTVPLARRSTIWRWAIGGVLLLGGLLVLGFWAGFLADYPVARDIYFTIALVHVLAEVPFLLRSL